MAIRRTGEGTPQERRVPEKIEGVSQQQIEQAKQAEEVMYSGLQSLVQTMYQWADQLQQQVEESKGVGSKGAAAKMRDLEGAYTQASQTVTEASAPPPASLVPPPEVLASASPTQKYVVITSSLERVAKIVKEIEVISITSRRLASMNYNEDPSKLLPNVKDQFQTLFTAANELKGAQASFDQLAQAFPRLNENKNAIDRAFDQFFSAGGALSQLANVNDQLQKFSTARHPALAISSPSANLLNTAKTEAVNFFNSLTEVKGPLKTLKSHMVAWANQLAAEVSPPQKTGAGGLAASAAVAGGPAASAADAGTGSTATGDDDDSVPPPPPNLWEVFDDIVLGKVMPGFMQLQWGWEVLIGIGNRIMDFGTKLLSAEGKFSGWTLGGQGTSPSAQIKNLIKHLKTLEADLQGDIASIKSFLYNELKTLYKPTSQGGLGPDRTKWPSQMAGQVQGLQSALGNLEKLYSKMFGKSVSGGNALTRLQYILSHDIVQKKQITPGGKGSTYVFSGTGSKKVRVMEFKSPCPSLSYCNNLLGQMRQELKTFGANLNTLTSPAMAQLSNASTEWQTVTQNIMAMCQTLAQLGQAIVSKIGSS